MKLQYYQLLQQLKKELAPIYLLSSDEEFLKQETKNIIIDAAKDKGFSEIITFYLEKNFAWQQFTASAYNLSLFAEKTLLILNNSSDKFDLKAQDILYNYAQNPPTNKILLIIMEKMAQGVQNAKWVKAIIQSGVVTQLWPLANEFPKWLATRLQQKSLTINHDGINLLAKLTEGNLAAADQAIEKLYLLYGACNLTCEQIATALSDNTHFTIFNLADTFLQTNTPKSLQILHALKQQKIAPTLILWALAREIRSLIALKTANLTIDQAMQQQNILWNRKELIKKAAQIFTVENLYSMLQQCAIIDRTIKGAETSNVWFEFEKLIYQ